MKLLFALLFVVAVIFADHLPRLPEAERINLKNIHNACQADPKTYADEDLLRNLLNNQDVPVVLVHMLCMAEKAGLVKANGDLNLEVIRAKVDVVTPDKSQVDGLVKKCAIKQNNAQRNSMQIWTCFVLNDIQYYHKL